MLRVSSILLATTLLLMAQTPQVSGGPGLQDNRTLHPQQAAASASLPTEKRIALVIGNGGYKDAPLKNPVNDARAMAAVLRGCGFQVIELEDAPLQKMREGLRNFGMRIASGGVGLFYYAGHGMQVKGRNYLIPVAANITSEDEVAGSALDVDSVLAKLETAKNRLNILILDACRNDPFARSFRSGSQGLAPLDAPMGTFIAFATAPGRTAADGLGDHGLYTEQLLQALSKPGLKLEETFKLVLSGVRRRSQGQQVPWTSSSVEGDFFFRPEGAALPSAATALVGETAPAEPATSFLDYLEGAKAQKAFVKSGFETQPEFESRISRLPPLRVGSAKPLGEGYDMASRRLPLQLQMEAWVASQVKQGRVEYVEVDRDTARTICEGLEELPVVARFEFNKGLMKTSSLAIITAAGAVPIADSRPVPGAERNTFGLWETILQVGACRLPMVLVPAGRFRMGSNEPNWSGKPLTPHEVTIPLDFWIGKFPVTQGVFRDLVGSNPSYFSKAGPDAPVERVSWKTAQAFCDKLNSLQQQWTFRLPSAAEWEYACRAGSETEVAGPHGVDAIAATLNSWTTHPVGQGRPNDFGIYDMVGNATEWCQDRSGSNRIQRGGYLGTVMYGTASENDGSHYGIYGFRLVATLRVP